MLVQILARNSCILASIFLSPLPFPPLVFLLSYHWGKGPSLFDGYIQADGAIAIGLGALILVGTAGTVLTLVNFFCPAITRPHRS